jgi:hypothetical protein
VKQGSGLVWSAFCRTLPCVLNQLVKVHHIVRIEPTIVSDSGNGGVSLRLASTVGDVTVDDVILVAKAGIRSTIIQDNIPVNVCVNRRATIAIGAVAITPAVAFSNTIAVAITNAGSS